MTEGYLDVMHNEVEEINNAAYELKSLSKAFYETGNDMVGDILHTVAENLFSSAGNINKAVGQDINDQRKAAQQGVANVVKACLSMTTKEE